MSLGKKPYFGANSSINVIYSGTMSAAVEAGIEGIKSIGFSLLDYNWDANFLPCEKYVEKITKLAIIATYISSYSLSLSVPGRINKEGSRLDGRSYIYSFLDPDDSTKI